MSQSEHEAKSPGALSMTYLKPNSWHDGEPVEKCSPLSFCAGLRLLVLAAYWLPKQCLLWLELVLHAGCKQLSSGHSLTSAEHLHMGLRVSFFGPHRCIPPLEGTAASSVYGPPDTDDPPMSFHDGLVRFCVSAWTFRVFDFCFSSCTRVY